MVVSGVFTRRAMMCVCVLGQVAAFSSGSLARQCTGWERLPAPAPARRSAHSMVYVEHEGKTLLFGGYSFEDEKSIRFGDTWTWDGQRWKQLQVEGPSPRSSASMAYDPMRRTVLLYGGHSYAGRPTDTWSWDGRRWSLLSEVGPEITDQQPMAFDPLIGRIILFDGRTGRPSRTYVWTDQRWMPIATDGPALSSYTLVTDTDRDRVLLFSSAPYPRIYEWTGTDWKLRSTESGPGEWSFFALSYDAGRQSVIYTGGSHSEQSNGATWEWNDSGWSRIAVEPALARSSHSTVYDVGRSRLVLFGGCDQTGRYSDTWEADTDRFLSLVEPPRSREAVPGEPVSFAVQVVASGVVGYQWRKDGMPLDDDERISGSQTERLRIDGVKSFDIAVYDVVVSRECGSVVSAPASLKLKSRPAIEVTGACPGRVRLRLVYAYPNANVALFFGSAYGPMNLWLEPCGPTTLGVRPPRLQVVGMYRAGPEGTLTLDGRIGERYCDGFVQIMDFGRCLTSNVVAIP